MLLIFNSIINNIHHYDFDQLVFFIGIVGDKNPIFFSNGSIHLIDKCKPYIAYHRKSSLQATDSPHSSLPLSNININGQCKRKPDKDCECCCIESFSFNITVYKASVYDSAQYSCWEFSETYSHSVNVVVLGVYNTRFFE